MYSRLNRDHTFFWLGILSEYVTMVIRPFSPIHQSIGAARRAACNLARSCQGSVLLLAVCHQGKKTANIIIPIKESATARRPSVAAVNEHARGFVRFSVESRGLVSDRELGEHGGGGRAGSLPSCLAREAPMGLPGKPPMGAASRERAGCRVAGAARGVPVRMRALWNKEGARSSSNPALRGRSRVAAPMGASRAIGK